MLQLIASVPQLAPRRSGDAYRAPLVHADDRGAIETAVVAAARGDRAAFAELWDTYHAPVHRFVLHRLGGLHADADDVVSETFIQVWRSLSRFTFAGAPFRSWLFTIADRQVLMHIRRAARHTSACGELPSELATELDEQLDPGVAAAMSALPTDQQRVLLLRFVGDLDTAQIAAALGRSEDAVRQLQARAMRTLRDVLDTRATTTRGATA